MQLLIAQYNSLRQEFVSRVEIEHQLSGLAVIAAGTVMAAGLQAKNPMLILLVPYLSMFLAAAWTHNNRRVRELSAYIKSKIEPEVGQANLGFETYRNSRDGQFGRLNHFATRGIIIGTALLALLVGATMANVGDALSATAGHRSNHPIRCLHRS